MSFKEFCQRQEIVMLKGAFQSWLVEKNEFGIHSQERWEALYSAFESAMASSHDD